MSTMINLGTLQEIKDLRARAGFGLDKAILGYVKSGIYQIYEEQEKDGYKWLKITNL